MSTRIDIKQTATVGATLMKTGQTTSYRTGDDGDIEAGRSVDFFTLSANNPFGNTNRFTDELGGQTYTNNIVIDWSTYNGSTVLGWYKGAVPIETWANAIDNAALLTVGSFSTWKIPNANEMYSIANHQSDTSCWKYPPFNNTTWTVVWTSTTAISATSNAIVGWQDQRMDLRGKTSTSYSLRCRNFTVTGTILT